MNKPTAIGISVLGAALLVGAGVSAWNAGPNPEAICTRGVDKFIICMDRFAPEAAEMSRKQRDEGIPKCASDPKKVDYYATCLEHESCEAFVQCAVENAPKAK